MKHLFVSMSVKQNLSVSVFVHKCLMLLNDVEYTTFKMFVTQMSNYLFVISFQLMFLKHWVVVLTGPSEYRNTDFNIITDNEALVIDIDLSNNQNLILATIYCPNGNPNLRLFETIKNLTDNIMFVGDFNSKLEAFGCAKKNTSGPMLKNIQIN